MKTASLLVPVALLARGIVDLRSENLKTVEDFRAAAAKTNAVLTIPDWEQTPEAVDAMMKDAIAISNKALDRIGAQDLSKALSKLGTDFDSNIVNAKAPLVLTKAELDGVPESFLLSPGVRTGDDAYTVLANVTWQYNTVEDNAKSEATRKKLYIAHDSLAKDTNQTVLNQMLALRNKIALRLGYKSWDDYQTEIKMARTGDGAKSYIDNLISGIQPKFAAEVVAFQKMKAEDAHNPEAKIGVWDWRYYTNQLKKQQYTVDTEALRAFFPLQKVLEGMFNIYQSIFSLKFEKIAAPYKWIDDLQFYMVTDAATGEPLGMFYLDMFPREGKFNNFAEFPIISGKQLADGKYQRPVP